jgi:hypothetical protein
MRPEAGHHVREAPGGGVACEGGSRTVACAGGGAHGGRPGGGTSGKHRGLGGVCGWWPGCSRGSGRAGGKRLWEAGGVSQI